MLRRRMDRVKTRNSRSAAARGRSTGVTLETRAVADHRELSAFATGVAFVPFKFRLTSAFRLRRLAALRLEADGWSYLIFNRGRVGPGGSACLAGRQSLGLG